MVMNLSGRRKRRGTHLERRAGRRAMVCWCHQSLPRLSGRALRCFWLYTTGRKEVEVDKGSRSRQRAEEKLRGRRGVGFCSSSFNAPLHNRPTDRLRPASLYPMQTRTLAHSHIRRWRDARNMTYKEEGSRQTMDGWRAPKPLEARVLQTWMRGVCEYVR